MTAILQMKYLPKYRPRQTALNEGAEGIGKPDDFLISEEGLDRLDGICMMLIAIGENLKNLDKVTGGKLLVGYPEVDWKGAKGMRDIISHHYFDLNAEIVFSICKDRIPGLIKTITKMKSAL